MENHTVKLYDQENQELADWFFDAYYWSTMKENSPRHRLKKMVEIIISPQCNLGCKYCYIHKNRNTIFNPCLFDEEKTIKNLEKLLNYFRDHNLTPVLEIFSGELLAQDIGWRVLDTILAFERKLTPNLRIPEICIPTNFTFLCDDILTERIENLFIEFKKLDIELSLSASFDGKYMEENRPFIRQLDIPINVIRDDAYYDKVFKFIDKHNCGIHPMIYSEGIDRWIQNFDWFQEQMEKHGIKWDAMYLLQVRNPNWTDDNLAELIKFIKHIYYFAWEKCEHDKTKFKNFLLHRRGFNILSQMVGVNNRGTTCAIQRTLHIRLSDFAVLPCHRLGNEDLIIGHFYEEGKELKFNAKNIELMIGLQGYDRSCAAGCEQCLIRSLCIGGCLGAQEEENCNMFSSIPSVCKMLHATCYAITECLLETDCFDIYCDILKDDTKIRDLIKLRKVIEKNDH